MEETRKIKFVDSSLSIEDLEQFRDEQGFIDLSLAGIEFSEESREKKGTAERLKNWVNFNGTKALIRENVLDNFSVYSELIVEELSKQAGLEAARYDLVKFCKPDGTYSFGVLSESMLDFDKEDLFSLHDFIGDEPEAEYEAKEDILESLEYTETTRYDFTIDRLVAKLKNIGYSEDKINELVKDYQKRLVFAIKVLDSDKHSENISFILRENGELEMSPVYDSEFSLLLERDPESLQFFLDSGEIDFECNIVSPKIGSFVSEENGGLGSMWKDTLERLCEDDDVYDFYEDLRENIDIDTAIKAVEEKIHAKLPEIVEKVAKSSYKSRATEMDKVMGDEELIQEEAERFEPGFDFLIEFLKKGNKAGVRLAEQVSVRKTDGRRFRTNKKWNKTHRFSSRRYRTGR